MDFFWIAATILIAVGIISAIIGFNLPIWIHQKVFYLSAAVPVGNQFGSFAPIRKKCQVKWYSNGDGFMSDVADAISKAKKEIYITDWMLSPHIYLKRTHDKFSFKLKDLLLKKAEEDNVKIFVLLFSGDIKVPLYGMWKPVDVASDYAEKELQHRNIVVLRHASDMTLAQLVWDIIRHKSPMWSHHEKTVVIDQTLAFVGGIDLCYGRWDTHEHPLNDDYDVPPQPGKAKMSFGESNGTKNHYQRWVGKDYCNTFIRDAKHLDQPFIDSLNRKEEPRLPWHDIACCVFGEPARDVAQHFIQRFNFTKKVLKARRAPVLQPWNDDISKYHYLAMKDAHSDSCNCQVVRSVSKWSAGVDTEHSIQSAYLEIINNAEHFIYIENQFFISSMAKHHIKNQIVQAIADRIIRAHKDRKKFRVIIVLPQKPEFAGTFGETSGDTLEAVTYVGYKTILSLYDCLRRNKVPCEDYLGVYALHKHDTIGGKPVSEVVYVHAKCMIVDDKVAIIGSANINDRSMLGERDSEMCVVIKDTVMTDNGKPYREGEFCHSLRCRLFREHLGLVDDHQVSDSECFDPLSDAFYKDMWKKTADVNWHNLKNAFKLFPANEVETYDQLKDYKKLPKPKPEEQLDLLAEVKGTLVPMQFRFLEHDLEKMWVPRSIRKKIGDIRRLPEDILIPIVAVQIEPKTTSEPALPSHIDEELKTDLISRMTHFVYHL